MLRNGYLAKLEDGSAPMIFHPASASLPDNGTSANHTFAFPRADYQIDLTGTGSLVVGHGDSILVPFGDDMVFADMTRTSKNTIAMVHDIHSQAENYNGGWEVAGNLPVDFLRTGAAWGSWDDGVPSNAVFDNHPDKVTVAYVNTCEFTAVGGWDPSFNPAWDSDHDGLIDPGTTGLPAYVDVRAWNAQWHNYAAKFWTQAWRDQLAAKIDVVAAQGFDGVMLDVMTECNVWNGFSFNHKSLAELRSEIADLFRWVSDYAKQKYGDGFIVTANLDRDAHLYFPDMGQYIDAGYYQNAFFTWDGSGADDPAGAGRDAAAVQFLKDQGIQLLTMDHIGTGSAEGVDWFTNYDGNITEGRLIDLLLDAVGVNATPFVSPLLLNTAPYSLTPRFARVDDTHTHAATDYDDWVIGSPSNDKMHGGNGDDLFLGGKGDDLYDGGPGTDTAVYLDAPKGVHVDLAITKGQATGGGGKDTLKSIENVIGSNYADTLLGNGGDNTIEGGKGNDKLDGRGAFDFASYATSEAGVTVSLAVTGQQDTHGAGLDTLKNFEGLIGSDFNDTLTGDDNANTLKGGNGDDILNGGAGPDVIIGGFGTDQLTGGPGGDTFVFPKLETTVDLIKDIASADIIDLSGIDANLNLDGDQAFTKVSHFTGHAGQLCLVYDKSHHVTHIRLDVDGDGNADMTINLSGKQTSFHHFDL